MAVLLKALLWNTDVSITQLREWCVTLSFLSEGDFILDQWRSKCGCRGGGTWPITLGTKEEIFLTLLGGRFWNQARISGAYPLCWKSEGVDWRGTRNPGRRWVSWQHPEVYSHVEWQLHLGMGQQLRGYGCHFGGHQYPCRGGRGTRVRCILREHRKIHTDTRFHFK